MKLKSFDDVEFNVKKEHMMLSQFIINVEETLDNEDEVLKIPFEKATAFYLDKCIRFCEHYTETNDRPQPFDQPLKKKFFEYVSDWYLEFFTITEKELLQLTEVANFLHIDALLQMCVVKFTDIVKFRTTEEIRAMFNIESDFTPEEEQKIKKENEWLEKVQNQIN